MPSLRDVKEEVVKLAAINQPVLLLGSPGVGKTSIARQVAEELELPYVEVRAAEFEPVDFRGGMYLDESTETARWFAADIWPSERCVLCFDEITQAHSDLTSPLLKVIRERKIGNTELHPDTIIIATGNRVADRAGCFKVGSALRDSFIVYDDISVDFRDWVRDFVPTCSWDMEIVVEFLTENPDMWHTWDPAIDGNQPSPRNWAKVGQVFAVTESLITLAGLVGEPAAKAFRKFADQKVRMPKVEDVLVGKEELPTDPAILRAWTDSLVAFATQSLPDEFTHQDVCRVIEELPETWAIRVLRLVGKSDPKVLHLESYREIVRKHSAAIVAASSE